LNFIVGTACDNKWVVAQKLKSIGIAKVGEAEA